MLPYSYWPKATVGAEAMLPPPVAKALAGQQHISAAASPPNHRNLLMIAETPRSFSLRDDSAEIVEGALRWLVKLVIAATGSGSTLHRGGGQCSAAQRKDGSTTTGGHAGNKERPVRSVPMTSNVRAGLGEACDGPLSASKGSPNSRTAQALPGTRPDLIRLKPGR